jgi:hypothetical protein
VFCRTSASALTGNAATNRDSQSGRPLKVGSNTPEMIAIGRKLA